MNNYQILRTSDKMMMCVPVFLFVNLYIKITNPPGYLAICRQKQVDKCPTLACVFLMIVFLANGQCPSGAIVLLRSFCVSLYCVVSQSEMVSSKGGLQDLRLRQLTCIISGREGRQGNRGVSGW
jgi:hypothetical protein